MRHVLRELEMHVRRLRSGCPSPSRAKGWFVMYQHFHSRTIAGWQHVRARICCHRRL